MLTKVPRSKPICRNYGVTVADVGRCGGCRRDCRRAERWMATRSDLSERRACEIVPEVWDDVFGQPLFCGAEGMATATGAPERRRCDGCVGAWAQWTGGAGGCCCARLLVRRAAGGGGLSVWADGGVVQQRAKGSPGGKFVSPANVICSQPCHAAIHCGLG
jgi:hypothetical protein